MSWKSRGDSASSSRSVVSQKWTLLLCLSCFCAGMVFINRMWSVPESKGLSRRAALEEEEKLKLVSEGCHPKALHQKEVKRDTKDIFGEVFKTHNAIQTLDKTIEFRDGISCCKGNSRVYTQRRAFIR